MKNLALFVATISWGFALSAQVAPQYTLQQICDKYGQFNQCQSVPFCASSTIPAGCQLADGAAPYMEALCHLQTEKQGCSIMQAQGNCTWLDQSVSSCNAKMNSL